jgi:hypothetical protein
MDLKLLQNHVAEQIDVDEATITNWGTQRKRIFDARWNYAEAHLGGDTI